jgi:biopolymer transport protein ExbD
VAGGASDDDDDGITGINVTPLVDIMLVLLIIFMVTASYIVKPSIEVDLPKAASGGDTLDTTLSIVLARDGTLFLNGEQSSRDAIAARCKEVSVKDPKAQAIIAADNQALHGQVVSLIDLIRVNGVLKFAINIKPMNED